MFPFAFLSFNVLSSISLCFLIFPYASLYSHRLSYVSISFLFYVLFYIHVCFICFHVLSYVYMWFLMFLCAFLYFPVLFLCFHVLSYVYKCILTIPCASLCFHGFSCAVYVHASGHLNNRSILFASVNFYLFLNVFMRFSVLFGSFVCFLVLYCASLSNIDLLVLACTSANPWTVQSTQGKNNPPKCLG